MRVLQTFVIVTTFVNFTNRNGWVISTSTTFSFANNEKCEQEGETLSQKEALTAALPPKCLSAVYGTSSDKYDLCTNAHLEDIASFQKICRQAGGVNWVRNVRVVCLNETETSSIPSNNATVASFGYSNKVYGMDSIGFEYQNIPTCLGASCNLTEVEDAFDAAVPLQLAENVMAEYGLVCAAEAWPASVPPTNVKSSAPDVTTFGLRLSFSLLLLIYVFV